MPEPTTNDPQSPLFLAAKFGLETTPTKALCHYTSQKGLIGILSGKAMYATDATYLNDSQEVVYAVNLAKRYFRQGTSKNLRFQMEMMNVLDRTESLVGEIPVYVASFSEEPDLLSQWRGYCSEGPGFALCFFAEQIEKLALVHRWSLFKCIYDVEQQMEVIRKIEEYANAYHADNSLPMHVMFGVTLLSFATVLKHPKFREESEWRAIQRAGGSPSIRPGASTLVPYINFPLTLTQSEKLVLEGLVVGPTPHSALAVRAVKSLLAEKSVICPEPQSSEIPFRNW